MALRIFGAVMLVVVSLMAVMITPSPATAQLETPPGCIPIPAGPVSGAAAIDVIGDAIDEVAEANSRSADELTEMLYQDPTVHVDPCGKIYFVEEALDFSSAQTAVHELAFPESQTFLLNSLPGANRVIYLDFNGHVLTGTAWNLDTFFNIGPSLTLPPFSLDGSPSTWSSAEHAAIQSIWQRVSEDFAPFNVNVTTQDPGYHAIARTSAADTQYGTRVVITNDTVMASKCSCGGVAYLEVFNIWNAGFDLHSYYQPALVFTLGLSLDTKAIAEAASHEAGHNLGLDHHGTGSGTGSSTYYQGHDVWAPIMGLGYNRPLVQWSWGEYPNANRPYQDDIEIMQTFGLPLRTDDHANQRTSATSIGPTGVATGIIHTRNDVDWFSFTASGEVSIHAVPAPVSPNLDIQLDLYDGNGGLIETANPASTFVNFDQAGNLDANISRTLSEGTYYIRVQGVGKGTTATGYSDYGSIGQYTVIVTGDGVSPGEDDVYVGNLRVYLRPTPTTTRVFTRIDVVSNGSPLSGAVVSISVRNPNGTSSTYAAQTNADGYVMLAHTASALGTYVSEVLSISRDGYNYTPEFNYLTERGLRVRQ